MEWVYGDHLQTMGVPADFTGHFLAGDFQTRRGEVCRLGFCAFAPACGKSQPTPDASISQLELALDLPDSVRYLCWIVELDRWQCRPQCRSTLL